MIKLNNKYVVALLISSTFSGLSGCKTQEGFIRNHRNDNDALMTRSENDEEAPIKLPPLPDSQNIREANLEKEYDVNFYKEHTSSPKGGKIVYYSNEIKDPFKGNGYNDRVVSTHRAVVPKIDDTKKEKK